MATLVLIDEYNQQVSANQQLRMTAALLEIRPLRY
jgi:hypothetical protein